MKQQQALFRALLDDPDDDAARLVYADWLEEYGGESERSQLIRVQVRLFRLAPDDPGRPALQKEEARLLRGRKLVWKTDLPDLRGVRWGEFERGFVNEAIVQSSFMFHRHARRIVATIPLQILRIRRASALRSVGNSPCATHLRELYVVHQGIEADAVGELTDSAHLGKLEVLDLLGNSLGNPGAVHLARTSRLPALRVLDLSYNHVGPDGGRALAGSATLRKSLTTLRLVGNSMIDAGARAALTEAFGQRVQFV